jgi:hypothetical protein
MTLHSRLPVDLTLDQRVEAVNRLCDTLAHRGAQVERLRWRIAIELYTIQKIVIAEGLPWEVWCRENINRSLGDVRKLLKMAKAQDPEVAHGAEIAHTRERMRTRAVPTSQRALTRVVSPEQSAAIAARLIAGLLTCYPITEVRDMLDQVEMRDLIEALGDAEAASASARAVPFVSTTTH